MAAPGYCAVLIAVLLLGQAVTVPAQESESETPKTRGKYPSYDGSYNNLAHPSWGQRRTPFSRVQVPGAAYGANGGLAGANRPSPRAITLALLNKPYYKAAGAKNSSYLLTALGQLVSHDIGRGEAPAANPVSVPIPVPRNDPFMSRFDNRTPVAQGSRTTLPFKRTEAVRSSTGGPIQLNQATTWLDASCVYGETAEAAQALRAGIAGRLMLDEKNLLPYNVEKSTGLPITKMKNLAERLPQTKLRLAGNRNVNQNPMIMTITTVLVREHNRRARLVEAKHPEWSDEQVFNEARKWVIGHFQRIALVDYLGALGIALPPYQGYNRSLDPAIDNFFNAVAYRYGHSTIQDVVLRLDESWARHPKGHLVLRDAVYQPEMTLSAGIEPIIRGLLVQTQGKVEPRWVLSIAGHYLGDASSNGTDLPAVNIQRGRDHGIPDYNSCRRALGLPAAKDFADITPDAEIAQVLEQLYGNVNNIDPYIGGLAEPPQGNSHVGPLFTASFKEQFARLRDADYWYYENGANNKLYNNSEIEEIRKTTLRDILARNTAIKDLPTDIWAAGSMTCGADLATDGMSGSTLSRGRNKLQQSLLGGSASLLVEPSAEPGWVKVVLSSTGAGWLGFGVADPESASAMIGADMVVGNTANGAPQVRRYTASSHQPPTALPDDQQKSRLRAVKFERAGDQMRLEFERPTSGTGSDRPMLVDGLARLIVARGANNEISSFDSYHGSSDRELVELKDGLFGTASTSAADPKAVVRRKAHGLLMAINFVVILPLGALAARQLRSHWLQSPAIRASMFYIHIITQVAGIACATAGFVIATRWFNVPYNRVQFHHGKLGIATLVLVYSQLLMGFLRPRATAPTRRRHIWDIGHSTLGRAAMLIGLVNVGLGVVIFSFMYGGNFGAWAGACAAALAAISLLQYILDRQEKYAVLRNDREVALQAAAQADDYTDVDETGAPPKLGDAPAWGSQSAFTQSEATAGPTGASLGAAGAAWGPHAADAAPGARMSPKLTATVLQQHDASIGGQHPQLAGASHPAFSPFSPNGLPTGDVHNGQWDQAPTGQGLGHTAAQADAGLHRGQGQVRRGD